MKDWKQAVQIWEGLANFRQLRRDIARLGIEHIDQDLINKLYIGEEFLVDYLPTKQIIDKLEQKSEKAISRELSEELSSHKTKLENIEEDLVLRKSTENYNYEYVFKEEKHQIKGFVKISSKQNPKHVALLTWEEDSNDPILYIAELEEQSLRLQINFGGKAGLALIQESNSAYYWTHGLKCNYPDILEADHGSASMDKVSNKIELEEASLAAIEAAQKASTIASNNKTLFENNLKLMALYKDDLEKLLV